MSDHPLSPQLLTALAERFQALGEPARLLLLQRLRAGEATVTELVDGTGLTQANVSKHLKLLYSLGFVARRKHGVFVHYRLADRDVFRLCDLMCGRVERELQTRRRHLLPG